MNLPLISISVISEKPLVRHDNRVFEKDEVVVCLKFVLHVLQFGPKEREK